MKNKLKEECIEGNPFITRFKTYERTTSTKH